MKNEREDKSNINLSADGGIPKVSFGASGAGLVAENYDISGNSLVAYYDAAHKLIFVLDKTISDHKPNVLLVINPDGDRKWDDILANDYDVDLETVRPKVDNKYQKLDIEYSGLSVYNKLINEYNAGSDLTDANAELDGFRWMSARRAASERLLAAEESSAKTRDTIVKTNETMVELQAKLKKLREKLSKQKKEVGREPTKQSAAKILKTESQIDATNEKMKRTKKRLKNAQRRLVVSEEDAEIARNILGQKQAPAAREIKVQEIPREEVMAEEVKPLFDQDPEILDENIAFKPIDFSAVPTTAPGPVEETFVSEPVFAPIDSVPPAPLSFTPPTMTERVTEPEVFTEEPVAVTPVLETFVPVVEEPIIEPVVETPPVVPEAPKTEAPVARPVSPIAGTAVPVDDGTKTRKPTTLYYVMLVVLILLSVFTLWLYQKKTGDTVPELVAPTPEVVTPAPAPTPVVEPDVMTSPFIQAELNEVAVPVVPTPAPTYVEETIAEEPAAPAEPEEYYYPDAANAEPVYNVAEAIDAPAPVVAPVVAKPAYDVSTEKTFVADQNYEGDYDEPAPQKVCDDGSLADYYGCCNGEVYTNMGGGQFACCVDGTGECYPPM